MQTMDNFSYAEKKLLLELEQILVNYRYESSTLENINTSNATYMYRIKKALLKSKVEQKRITILNLTIASVNSKIARGMLFKEIFEPLPTIIEDMYRNYSTNAKVKKENQKNEDKNSNNLNKQGKLEAKTCFLLNIINQILAELEGSSREELLNYESLYKDYIKINTYNYGVTKANGEIIGSLNSGMIECTRKNLQKFLYEECRIRLNSNDKLSDKMSDELLKYRVAALIYTNVMCSKRIAKIRPEMSNKVNYRQYNGLKEDIRFLGKVIREKYIDEYGLSPKEELINNFINGQLTIEGLMHTRDRYTRKRDL